MNTPLFLLAGLSFGEKFISKSVSLFVFLVLFYAVHAGVGLLQKRKEKKLRRRAGSW